jgi:ribonucleoside-diphosphate reductase alpha chain
MFLDDTACNLASINVTKFYDQNSGAFDVESYLHCVRLVQLVLEATIHWGQYPTKEIARKSYLFRTTGLGLTNLGTLFMQMAVPYDSDEARTVAAALTSLMTGFSYHTSALMAETAGPFACYEINKEHMNKVIRNHARAAAYSDSDDVFEDMPYR